MSDEKPVPETPEIIAERIAALATSVDERFEQVGKRFEQVDKRFDQVDQRFSEMQAHLDMKIEAVHDDVKRIYDVLIAQQTRNAQNDADHGKFTKRLDDHDVRLMALEHKKLG